MSTMTKQLQVTEAEIKSAKTAGEAAALVWLSLLFGYWSKDGVLPENEESRFELQQRAIHFAEILTNLTNHRLDSGELSVNLTTSYHPEGVLRICANTALLLTAGVFWPPFHDVRVTRRSVTTGTHPRAEVWRLEA